MKGQTNVGKEKGGMEGRLKGEGKKGRRRRGGGLSLKILEVFAHYEPLTTDQRES